MTSAPRPKDGILDIAPYIGGKSTLAALVPRFLDPQRGAVLVSGQITGEAARMEDLEAVKRVLPSTPVLANTGVKHATVADVLTIADGCVVGSALKHDGHTWHAVDPARAADFMSRARAARGY